MSHGGLRYSASVVLTFAALLLGLPNTQAAGKVFVFNGKIESVNAGAGSFTLSGDGKAYAFQMTSETKVTWNGKPLSSSILRSGQHAEVEMKIGANGKGIATSVRLASPWTPYSSGPPTALSAPMAESLFAATTPGGRRLSAPEIKPLIVYATWPTSTHRVTGYLRIKPGVFLLSVRSDGTVEKVEILQSIGHRGADADMIKALSRWRFRPGSVKEVRVPSQYGFGRR